MRAPTLQTLRSAGRARPRSWAWLLLWALVLPSLWGTWHRVAHAPTLQLAAQSTASGAASDTHAPGQAECRLLDQGTCADGLDFAPLALPVWAGAEAPPRGTIERTLSLRLVLSYAARAPPTLMDA